MSQQDIAVATQAIEAFNATDVDAFAALTTPDFEWSPSMVAIHRERFHASEDLVVMLGRLEGQGKGSGVPVDASLGMVFDFRGGTISRIRGYLDHAEALRAAGL